MVRTKTKINVTVDTDMHKTFVKVCKAMGTRVSTFINVLMKSFVESERRPKESDEDLIKRIEKEFVEKAKRDKIIVF